MIIEWTKPTEIETRAKNIEGLVITRVDQISDHPMYRIQMTSPLRVSPVALCASLGAAKTLCQMMVDLGGDVGSPTLREVRENETCSHCGRTGRVVRKVKGDQVVEPWFCPGKAPGVGCKSYPTYPI